MKLLAEWRLKTQRIGRRVLWFDRVDSTNSLAARYALDSANDGMVFLADEQTAGRGKQGRTWLSPPGSSILCSVLLFPPASLRRPVILTTLAAVAICETIYQSTTLQAAIKWPNDVLVKGRKVCGVLVEQGHGTVIGIGLNVNTPADAFSAAQLNQAGSLSMFAGRELDRGEIAQTLIRQLDLTYADLQNGHDADLESRWRWHSGLLGKEVILLSRGQTYRGRLLELGFREIILQEAEAATRAFDPEAVEHISSVEALAFE